MMLSISIGYYILYFNSNFREFYCSNSVKNSAVDSILKVINRQNLQRMHEMTFSLEIFCWNVIKKKIPRKHFLVRNIKWAVVAVATSLRFVFQASEHVPFTEMEFFNVTSVKPHHIFLFHATSDKKADQVKRKQSH